MGVRLSHIRGNPDHFLARDLEVPGVAQKTRSGSRSPCMRTPSWKGPKALSGLAPEQRRVGVNIARHLESPVERHTGSKEAPSKVEKPPVAAEGEQTHLTISDVETGATTQAKQQRVQVEQMNANTNQAIGNPPPSKKLIFPGAMLVGVVYLG